MTHSKDKFRYIRGINYQCTSNGTIYYAKLGEKDFNDSFYLTAPAYYRPNCGAYCLEKEGEVSVHMEKSKGLYEVSYTFINLKE